MSTRIVLVHNDTVFLRTTAFVLREAGYDVEPFDNSMSALKRLEQVVHVHVDVLVTRVRFPFGQPNGLALARMARLKKPWIKIVVTAAPGMAYLAEGLGVVLEAPVTPKDVVEAVRQALAEEPVC